MSAMTGNRIPKYGKQASGLVTLYKQVSAN